MDRARGRAEGSRLLPAGQSIGVAGVSTLYDVAEKIGAVRETALLEGDDRVVLGAFQHLRVPQWKSEIDVLIDVFSRKSEDITEFSLSMYLDVQAERSEAFAISTDSGKQ